MSIENGFNSASLPDLTICDREPIHIPGSIQSYGCLLALSEERLRINQATPTCMNLLGLELEALLGQDLGQVLGSDLQQRVGEALARHRVMPAILASFLWQASIDRPMLAGYVHESDGSIVLELEYLAGDEPEGATDPAPAMTALNWVRAEPGLEAKANAAAALLQQLTGFDRVMVYRFDADWHGEVIAESRNVSMESYLGLHFPASDIPAQARQLYLVNPTRVIADTDALQSPIFSMPASDGLASERPLDLTKSLLRSVSPVHIEYLRNMGVRASLSSALIRDGKLWGLIACHHGSPRRLGRGARELLGWMVQDLSTQLALAEEVRIRDYAARLKSCRNNVIAAMCAGARLNHLIQGPALQDILGAIGADGVALIRGDELTTGGITPEPMRIRAIVEGLSGSYPDDPSGVFLTDCLSRHVPETADLAPTAAGLALFPLVGSPLVKLIWFRGEQVRLVTWAGNPDKAADLAPNGRINPRQSFSAWTQEVRLRSLPWTAEEVESARHLTALVDIELHKTVEDALRVSLADLQRHDAWMDGLNRMNDLLLSCETREEAEAIIAQGAGILFAGQSGAVALRQEGRSDLHLAVTWGDRPTLPKNLKLSDCWALRGGKAYEVADPVREILCPHVLDDVQHPYLCFPLIVRGEVLGLLHLRWNGLIPAMPMNEFRPLVQAVGESIKRILSNLQLQSALREQAIHDPHTGLFNRRYLDETLPREVQRCLSHRDPLAVAMLDLEVLNALQDEHGHGVTSQLLPEIGEWLGQFIRGGEMVCHYGIHQILFLLPDTPLEEACQRTDQLHRELLAMILARTGLALGADAIPVGVVALGEGDNDARLLAKAEASLSRAKAGRRGTVAGAGGD